MYWLKHANVMIQIIIITCWKIIAQFNKIRILFSINIYINKTKHTFQPLEKVVKCTCYVTKSNGDMFFRSRRTLYIHLLNNDFICLNLNYVLNYLLKMTNVKKCLYTFQKNTRNLFVVNKTSCYLKKFNSNSFSTIC